MTWTPHATVAVVVEDSPLVVKTIEDYRNGRRYPLDVVSDPQT